MEEVSRIIRVDHAGEYGAIQIYRAQLLIAKLVYKDIVPILQEMLSHERQHFQTFNNILKNRAIRHCYALEIWALGGFCLGLITALTGRNAIWACTSAIETTVLEHLEEQLSYLKNTDFEAYEAVLSIKDDEIAHQSHGNARYRPSFITDCIKVIVKKSTEFAIWLSTRL